MNDLDEILSGPPGRDAKRRTCLKCGRRFMSTWAGHRICFSCGKKNKNIGSWGVRGRIAL